MADDYLQSGICWWNAARGGGFSGAATISASAVTCSGATAEVSCGSGGRIFSIHQPSGSASVRRSFTFQDSHKVQSMDSTMQIPAFGLSPSPMNRNQAMIGRDESSFHATHEDDLRSRSFFSPAINSTGDSPSSPFMDMNQSFLIQQHHQLSSNNEAADCSFVVPSTSYYDGQSQNYSSPMSGGYRPTNELHFSDNTAYWNVPAAASASEEVRPVFYSTMPAPSQIIQHKLSSNLTTNTKLNSEGAREPGCSTTKKNSISSSSSEPAFEKTRIEMPSPLPTFKVRKEKLGDRITALQQLVSPFGKTDTASVLHDAIEYIKFLHDQVNVFSTPYLKNQHHMQHHESSDAEDGPNKDLESRGLCLVPIASTYPVASEIPADLWTSTFGGTYRTEVALGFLSNAGGQLKPADLLLHCWEAGDDCCVDVTITSPFAGGGAEAYKVSKTVEAAVTKKKRKYDDKCRLHGHRFLAFAVTSLGEFALDSLDVLKRLVGVASGTAMGSKVARFIYARISFMLHKGLGAQLVARLPASFLTGYDKIYNVLH